MSYKVLYRKYRPNDFDNIVGQEYTIEMLKNAIITGKNAHAYIFTGPRGTGKTSSAKVFAKALNCEHPINGNPCNECHSCQSFKESPDIIEIDAASNNGVDEIRELINNVKLVPSNSKYKIYIIDEVHMLTASAFNALLLTLEEPPSHVVFILATTDIQDVPITILSRCQRFDFKPISRDVIVNRLKKVCNEESIAITDEALNEIALISAGGMRDALGMLDQLSSDDKEITLDVVSNYFGSVSIKKIDELLTSIEENNVPNLLKILGNIKESGTNYAVFIEKFILELRKTAIEIKEGKSSHDMYFEDIYNMIFDLNECLCNININIDPYVLIEIVLLKYVNRNNLNEENKEIIKDKIPSKEEVKKSIKEPEMVDKTASYFPGNNSNADFIDKKDNKSDEDSNLKSQNNDDVKHEVINNQNIKKIDLNIRINNCFVDCTKEMKNKISSSWIDFMNYLMNQDRSLISLLADTSILASSDKYVLIQSKIDTTNELINNVISKIEKFYTDYSGINYRFAAINEDLWKKETEKYRFNLKNKIKYNYINEEIDDDSQIIEEAIKETTKDDMNDIEEVAKDIFGTFEIE